MTPKKGNTSRRRILLIALALILVAALVVGISILARQSRETEATAKALGLTTAEMKALYEEGKHAGGQGEYLVALSPLGRVSGYLDADALYAQALDGYHQQTQQRAESYLLIDQHDAALTLLDEAREALVMAGADASALDAQMAQVRIAQRQHYLGLAEAATTEASYAQALSLLDTAEAATGADEAIDAQRALVTAAAAGDYTTRYDALLTSAQYDEAVALMDEARALLPQNADFSAMLLRAKAHQASSKAESQAAAGNHALALQTLDEAILSLGDIAPLSATRTTIEADYKANYLTRYDALMASGAYDAAIALMHDGARAFPEDASLSERLLAASAAQADIRAQAQADSGSYALALQTLDDAIAALGETEVLAARRAAVQSAYKDDLLSAYADALAAGQYDEAIALMVAGEKAFPGDANFPAKLAEAKAGQAGAKADAQAAEGHYALALETLAEATRTLGKHEALASRKAVIESVYRADFLARYEQLMVAEEYLKAEMLMDEAVEAFPEDAVFAQKRDEAEAAGVVPIATPVPTAKPTVAPSPSPAPTLRTIDNGYRHLQENRGK